MASGRLLEKSMLITVNGAPLEVSDAVTVRVLVEHLGLVDGPVAVEIGGVIVPRAQHAERRVQPGDSVEIVHFVGGG